MRVPSQDEILRAELDEEVFRVTGNVDIKQCERVVVIMAWSRTLVDREHYAPRTAYLTNLECHEVRKRPRGAPKATAAMAVRVRSLRIENPPLLAYA